MTAPVYLKDPDAVVDYPVDWSDWLGDDTIATSAWAITGGDDSPPALAVGDDDTEGNTAIAWLSGGDAGVDYIATNTITTAQGRTDQRSLRIHVREQ